MILAIDIGNTNIVIGCFHNNEIIFRERISTNQTSTSLEYASFIKTAFEIHQIDYKDIKGAIISSVVPGITSTVKSTIEGIIKRDVMVVGPGIKTGLNIQIDNPSQLGSDLAVCAVAAINEYDGPLIVIDMGTATTISAIDTNSRYLGGSIAPGVLVSHDALINRTSQLQKVSFDKPKHVIGTNTKDCIKTGLLYGSAAMIDGLIDRIQEEMGKSCKIIATGGLSTTIIPLCKHKIIIDKDLLLKGLMVIYNKNK